MKKHFFLGILLFVVCFATFATPAEFEFPFWSMADVEKDSRFIGKQESACGDLAMGKVKKMPMLQSGDVLGTDLAFQLNKNSRITRTWNLPANAVPLALSGRALVFSLGKDRYTVTTSGVIQIFSSSISLDESRDVQCQMPKYYLESAYARCRAVPLIGRKEGASKRFVVAFQGPCT